LKHQLRSPVIQAHKRVKNLLKSQEFQEDLQWKLWAIRGLCRKANRVVMNTSLFENLAREKPIQPKLSRLQCDDTIKLMIEAARDNELMLDPSDHIKFEVDRSSFDILKFIEVRADLELLEQAVNCLFDNAGKYSLPDATVRIRGRTTHKGKFQIAVTNKGLKLTPNEALHCADREWRSKEAKLVTEEGSGIGLWIVDNIMQAHGGELSIIPSSQDGFTEVRLIFPILIPK
jgi:K+-sensing histidine kinase KdpD